MNKRVYTKNALESQEQELLFEWAEMQAGKHPVLKKMYHIPNGGSRHLLEAMSLKRQGVKSGVPDICLPTARGKCHGLYIELKRREGGKITPEQTEWMDALMAEGYMTAVCLGADEAMKVILDYLKSGRHGE